MCNYHLLLTFLTMLLLAGCQAAPVTPTQTAFQTATPVDVVANTRPLVAKSVTDTPYFLQVGDQLDVKFFYSNDLNQAVIVRPDGKITLQLIGEIHAAGLTPEGLKQIVGEGYKGILRKPEVSVIVREFSPQRIYVGGEVNNPGEVFLSSNLTLLQAIIRSGGFAYDAESADVVLLRHNGSDTPDYHSINVASLLERDPSIPADSLPRDIQLQPYDVVFVPQTTIASVAQFFRRYVNEILPIYRNMGLAFTYELHREKDQVTISP